MKIILTSLLFLCLAGHTYAQQKTIQERLGYPKNTKLVIIHADDLGVSHSENSASIKALETGSVSSASIMVPCPWFGEIAAYASAHPQADLGLHLTLTSEWKLYKWGSVTPKDQAASLADDKGFLFDALGPLYKNAKIDEVEKELRGQIERAKQFGINPTHFDSHMGSAFANPEFLKIYVKLGHEYKVPVLMNPEIAQFWLSLDPKNVLTDKDVIFDKVLIANPPDFAKGMEQFYSSTLKSVQPGLSYLILHAAYNNEEMQSVTVDHPDYGAAWRQADFNFFTSEVCKKLISEEHIQVITWREIKEKLKY
jgi:chitin disaccharide deacetylase